MAHIKIPSVYDEKQVLVVDDEGEHVQFLIDYLEGKGFRVTFVETAQDAISACESTKFRAYFIDLNIPFGADSLPVDLKGVYQQYIGLYVIRAIRSQGNSGARVLAYSAHYNDLIASEIERLYCKYVIKGRAKELKTAFDGVLEIDPVASKA
ncbi:TPA: response regulator [Pseudomonas aeruginosa]|uniref:response regulator n=1 Tax=Pseudomonas aeruginosa TaxID=287 RepID=UPI00291021EC|nr:response regulator [Pseudomonas aeruginosa]